jgi:AraC-like DNA-binding protein
VSSNWTPASSSRTGPVTRSARSVLINSSIALVEDWATQEAPFTRSAEDYSPKTQICFPYRGVFIWHVGGHDIVGDANQILFVPPGEVFRLSQLHRDGCGELIITPHADVVAELVGSIERPGVHPLFRHRRRRADPVVQRASVRFRQLVRGGELDELAADELLLELVVSALQWRHYNEALHPGTRRLVDRAKTFLGANWDSTVRLKDIASAVGASAAYLTDAFRRAEGVPASRLPRPVATCPGVGRDSTFKRSDGASVAPGLFESQPFHCGVSEIVWLHALRFSSVDTQNNCALQNLRNIAHRNFLIAVVLFPPA